jgi:hypothetical protein
MTHSSDSLNPIVLTSRYVYYYSIGYGYRLIKLKWRFAVVGDNEFTFQTSTEAGGPAFAHADALLVSNGM